MKAFIESINRKLVLIGLVVGVIIYLLLGWIWQPYVNRQVSSLQQLLQRPLADRLPETTIERTLSLNIDPESAYLLESWVNPNLKLSVANQSDEPRMENLSEAPQTQDEVTSSFATSPILEKRSRQSLVQQEQVLEDLPFNGFSWVKVNDKVHLYQNHQPYTGWFDQMYELEDDSVHAWFYYEEGIWQDGRIISQADIQTYQGTSVLQDHLFPEKIGRLFYLSYSDDHAAMIDKHAVSYQINYQAADDLILTSPAGTANSRLVASTEDFVGMNLEVVEEAQTLTSEWLHLQIGFDDLGWVEKDSTGSSYVKTAYSEQELLLEIQEVMAAHIDQMDARVGAAFIHHETMAEITYKNQIFFPASTQKIYPMAELHYQYKMGILDPYDTVILTDADQVPGAGILQGVAAGSEIAIDELVNLVAIYSDNTAANMLMDTVGGGEVMTPHMHQIGLYETYVYGRYYNDNNGMFYTTPLDAARLFALLGTHRLNGDPYDDQYIEKLTMNSHNFLRAYLPAEVFAYNKSGLGETEQNDVANFNTPYGNYTLAVYTAEPWSYGSIPDQVGQLSAAVYQTFAAYQAQFE